MAPWRVPVWFLLERFNYRIEVFAVAEPAEWQAALSGKNLGRHATPAEAALAIEAELTRIETEIRTAREGKK